MNKTEPQLIMCLRHANTIYSYRARKWRVACAAGRRHFQKRRNCTTDINQIIISGPVYFPTRSISQSNARVPRGSITQWPSFVEYVIFIVHSGVCARLCAAVPQRESQTNCLVYYLIIMKREWGLEIEQKSTSRKLGAKTAHEVSISKAPTHKPLLQHKQGAARDTCSGRELEKGG